jgi:hypothetical protein
MGLFITGLSITYFGDYTTCSLFTHALLLLLLPLLLLLLPQPIHGPLHHLLLR